MRVYRLRKLVGTYNLRHKLETYFAWLSVIGKVIYYLIRTTF